MITVTVIGAGGADAMVLAERARRAVAKVGSPSLHFEYVEVGARDKINGVSKLPALAVGGHVIAEGSVPKMREIQESLTEALSTAYPDDLRVHETQTAPRCGGCGRDCLLTAPKCRVGVERAEQLGITAARR